MIEYISATSLDLDHLLSQVVMHARDIIPFDHGSIYIYDPTTHLLTPRARYQPGQPFPRLIQFGEGVVGNAAAKREPILVNDVTRDARYIAVIEGINSELAVPMLLNRVLLGVVDIESRAPEAFTSDHVKILQALADQAALAIHASQLYDMLNNRYERLTDSNAELLLRNEISRLATSDLPIEILVPQMAERLAKLVGADACALTVWDPNERLARRLAAYGIDTAEFLAERNHSRSTDALTADIVNRSQPIIINDAQRIEEPPTSLIEEFDVKSMLAMPLIARGRAIGATFLMNIRHDTPYTPSHVDTVASVLDQIALAIDNHVLLKDTQARLVETSALLEIAAIAASSLELDVMLRQVLKLSKQMLEVSIGAFLLYDRLTNTLVPRPGAYFGFPDHVGLAATRFHVTDPHSHIAIVFTSGSPYFSNNINKATSDTYTELILRAGLKSIMLAPLRVQDEPMGVFLVGNKRGDFTRHDANLLMAMGSHVAAALRNADLLADTRERLRETEALQRIAEITSSTLDVDSMLERAVVEAAELLDAEGALLLMPNASYTALTPHMRSRYGIAAKMAMRPLPLDSTGHIVHAYHTGKPFVSNDAPSDASFDRRNIITYPLNTRDRTLGTISLINRRSGDFEEAHVELTRAIASQIATSMENAQLFAAERNRADLMALINRIGQDLTATLDLQGLTRKVVRALHELIGYQAVAIALLDETNANLVVQASVSTISGLEIPEGYSYPVDQGITGRALRRGDAEIVSNVQDDNDFLLPAPSTLLPPASALVVPLRAGTRALGTIEALIPRVDAFQETDRMAMQTLATQVSVAIENARLWNQAQRRLLEQGIVHQIGQDLTAILDYNDLVNAVVKHMTRALDTSLALLTSYDSDTGQLAVEAEYHAPSLRTGTGRLSFLGQPLGSYERSIIARAIQTRRQIIIYRTGSGFQSDPIDGEQQDQLAEMGLTAQLTIPMIAGDRVIGCVVWMETHSPREFNQSDLRLAQTLTTQAGIAIENARLFRQAQRQAREQALLRRVAVGLSAMPDMETLLKQFTYETQLALESENAIIALLDDSDRFMVRAQSLSTATLAETVLGRVEMGRDLPLVFRALRQGLSVQYSTSAPTGDTVYYELLDLMEDRPGAIMLTPIVRRGETIGVVEVSASNSARVFDAGEMQLLEALANQGAIAIDNVSLTAREQRRLYQLERLQISSRNIAGQLQMETLLNNIVNEATAIFETPAVSLMTRDEGGEYYMTRAAAGLSTKYTRERRMHISEHNGMSPRFMNDEDIELFDDEVQKRLVRKEGIRSILSVPLIKGGQHLGVMNLYAKDEPRIFADEEIELALLFASQAAIAFENALLFEALEERAIELAKANQLKSEFLARISHELRTPMNSILNFSEMLLANMYGELTDKQADRIERILRNGRNLLALIDDLLDISKIDAGKMQLEIRPVNLRMELEATLYNLENQASSRGLYLKLDAPEALPPVSADAMRIKQIITNLIGNALKFTKQGGVTVRVRVGEYNGIRSVYTSVIDTGIGIKPDDQAIIFDEFRQADGSTTREYGGTGLGLAISKKLVEMMNGAIWVESEFGTGSTFSFVLPVYSAAVGVMGD
jgi:GAF domain-containing protein